MARRTFYISSRSSVYHRDRGCFYLQHARAHDAVDEFTREDPGQEGKLVGPQGKELTRCPRCGV